MALSLEMAKSRAHLQILDEQYLQSTVKLSQLTKSIDYDEGSIKSETGQIMSIKAKLRRIGIADYISQTGTSMTAWSLLGENNMASVAAESTYSQTATGLIDDDVSSLKIAEHQVSVHLQTLRKDRTVAEKTKATLGRERSRAFVITAQLSAQTNAVRGQLALLVRQESKSQDVAYMTNTMLARYAKDTGTLSVGTNKITTAGSLHSAGSPNTLGLRAVAAAESQLNVPYVWAGATPGVGFDCSGLVMWAWAQAGISLPHSAALQYEDTARVSLTDLQPGDLIFYAADGYIYHVVMYVGSGPYGTDTVIQAEEPGTDISYSPIPPGAFGAGAP